MSSSGGLVLIIGTIVSATAAFIWLAWRIENRPEPVNPQLPIPSPDLQKAAREDIEHFFNEEFREELRNRGRLHFEKIISENARFLQQDLHQTTTQLNDYMQAEITHMLREAFKKYEQSISDAKQMALDSIAKTTSIIQQQRQFFEQQLQTQSEAQKAEILARFEANMASIVNHYILRSIGSKIDLSDQLNSILAELETNKKAIIEDIKHGA